MTAYAMAWLLLSSVQNPLLLACVPAPHIADSVPVVLADTEQQGATFFRYVWIPIDPDPAKATRQISAAAMAGHQILNHSGTEQSGTYLGNGVYRYDLAVMAGGDPDVLSDLVATWNRFGGVGVGKDDHEPFTLTNAQQVGEGTGVVKVIAAPLVWAVGLDEKDAKVTLSSGTRQIRLVTGTTVSLAKPWDSFKDACAIVIDGQLAMVPKTALVALTTPSAVRVPAPYMGAEYGVIMERTACAAPIVHFGEFVSRGVSQTDGLGLWYAFRRIKKSPDPKVTDFDYILSQLSGTTLDEVRRRRKVQLAIVTPSKVVLNEGERAVWLYSGLAVPGRNQGLVGITGDARVGRPNHELPVATLDEFKPDAMEVFVEGVTLVTLLFSGYDKNTGEFLGELQDFAPDNIAADHSAPLSYDRRIDGWLDCVGCHCIHNDQPGPWFELTSSIGDMLRNGETNLTTVAGLKDPKLLDRLNGELTPRYAKPLRRANDDFNESLHLLTGDPGVLEEGETTAKRHIGQLLQMWNYHSRSTVDARKALLHAGIDAPKEIAPSVVASLFAQVPGQVRYIDALASGRSIPATAFKAIAVDFLSQTYEARSAMLSVPQGVEK